MDGRVLHDHATQWVLKSKDTAHMQGTAHGKFRQDRTIGTIALAPVNAR